MRSRAFTESIAVAEDSGDVRSVNAPIGNESSIGCQPATARPSARRALGRAVAGWQAMDDSLPIGAFVLRTSPESSGVALDSANTRIRVQRLSLTRFVIAVDVTVPAVGPTLARRRMRVLLERPPSPDSTTLLAPRPLVRWPVAELY